MSRFSVDTDALKNATGRCEDISNSIGNLAIRIDNVKYSLDNSMGRYSGVLSALDTCVANSYKCSNKVEVFGSYGTMFATGYRTYEDRITGNIKLDKFGNVIVGDTGAGFDYRAVFEAIGKWAIWSHLFDPKFFVPFSALIGFIDWLYDDDPTDIEAKLKIKRNKGDLFNKELKKLRKDTEYAKAKGFKKQFNKETGKWEDVPDSKDGYKVETEVKLKEWQFLDPEKWSGSVLGDSGHLVAEGDNWSDTIDVLAYDVHADAYVGFLTAGASAGASFSLISAELAGHLGDDNLGAHGSVSSTIGRVGAEAEATFKLLDKNGNIAPTAKVEASAEAIAAEVSGTVGVNVAGADVSATATAQVGIGAHASFGFDEGKLTADVGAALGVGASFKIEVDVSKPINALCDGARSALETVGGWFKW